MRCEKAIRGGSFGTILSESGVSVVECNTFVCTSNKNFIFFKKVKMIRKYYYIHFYILLSPPTLTTILPRFLPLNKPWNASGIDSKPL